MSCIELPIVSFNNCNPQINLSEITYFYAADKNAADFTDWTNNTEWNNRLSNDGSIAEGSDAQTIDLIRKLTVIGDMPLPSGSIKEISGARTGEVKTNRVINLEIDEVTAENYAFIQATETVTGLFIKCWFKTAASVRWGGNSGITGYLKLRPVLSRGTSEIEKFTGTFTWHNIQSPGRYLDVTSSSELSGEGGGGSMATGPEIIYFTTESNISIAWNSARQLRFGNYPGSITVWAINDDGVGYDQVSAPIRADDAAPDQTNFIVYLPPGPGYIIIN